MGAAGYVGRVGSLAVALGVGTAIATGYGVAAADDTSTASSRSSSASSTSTTGAADAAQTTPDSTATAPASRDKPAATGTSDTAGDDTATSGTVVSAQTNTGKSAGSATTPKPSPKPKSKWKTKPKPESDATAPTPLAPAKKSKFKDTLPSRSSSVTSSPVTAAIEPTTKATTEKPKTALSAAKNQVATTTAASVAQVAAPDVAPPSPTVAQSPLKLVVSSVVNWVLNPHAGAGSTTPAQPPVAWSLLAFARREFEHFVTAVTGGANARTAAAVDTTSLSLAAATTPAVAAVNVPNFPLPGAQLSPSTKFVQWVTGNYQTGNPLIADTLKRFDITGTDVGVIWDNGMVDDPNTPYDEHQVLMAFGDTFSGANMTGLWRFNVLLRSADTNLSDGMTIPNGEWFNGNMFGGTPLSSPTTARQIIRADGLPGGVTLIPTAGISVPTPGTRFGVTQYVSVMSVTKWGAAGSWTTNYSAIASSVDNGENWTIAPSSVRYNRFWNGNKNFQQAAFVRPGDGYVYSYGTPNGRHGAAYVSRVAEKDILDASKYEYYSAGSAGGWFGFGATPAGWFKNNPSAATPLFGQDRAAKVGNQVSEMSVQYNEQLGKYVVLYGDRFNNIVMRTADTRGGDVVAGDGADDTAARRHLRTHDASMVAIHDGYRHRSLLEPIAVLAVQRDVDEDRPHQGLVLT